jgi:hypothetical protein
MHEIMKERKKESVDECARPREGFWGGFAIVIQGIAGG